MDFTVIPHSERAKRFSSLKGDDEVFLVRDNWDVMGSSATRSPTSRNCPQLLATSRMTDWLEGQQQMGTTMSMQWLLAKAPGFQALPVQDRDAIFNFTLLWSLFEAQVMGNFARADRICAKVDEWRDAGTL
ncbi:MAG: hypothetical protein AAFR01_11460, partial [Pseudomonadota bacterium]